MCYVTAGPSVHVLQIEEHLKNLRSASSMEELHESWHIFAPEVVSLMRMVHKRQMVTGGKREKGEGRIDRGRREGGRRGEEGGEEEERRDGGRREGGLNE